MIIAVGCETQSAAEEVVITPDEIFLRHGQSVEFTATGGYDYRWSIDEDKEGWGSLTPRTGSKTTFRNLTETPSNSSSPQILILTVTSTISGSSGDTNTSGYQASAEAIIKLI